ncbi:hypothetical protein FLL45_15275 [Aliikangiella marina]|uniref:Toxin CptA n=1 Tax=Aliikangiella marina TaxID=1712262 RepID=A0A545T6H3_9GAMM|nr:protein YgfX [Aliikangiella marina]TQV72827.1 hypothetical protein FLL45_15275 [Aliikangiella marina]
MKVAARFPVKSSLSVFYFIVLLHLVLAVCSYLLFSFNWQLAIAVGTIALTFYISYRRYLQLTSAPDDLCWSGENWLVSDPQRSHSLVYLALLPQSWLSSFACVLHFNDGETEHQWLFTRHGLGPRSYSELCYWVKYSLHEQIKQDEQAKQEAE